MSVVRASTRWLLRGPTLGEEGGKWEGGFNQRHAMAIFPHSPIASGPIGRKSQNSPITMLVAIRERLFMFAHILLLCRTAEEEEAYFGV